MPGSFLLGSALEVRRDLLAVCERALDEHGDVVRVHVGPPGMRRELHVLSHPDAAQRVLATVSANYRKDNIFYAEIRAMLGDGLLTSQDDDWQHQKRFLQPLFTPRRVAGYADAVGDAVTALAARWRAAPGGVDLHHEMTQLTLRIVCRVLFGDDMHDAVPAVQRSFGPLAEAIRRRGLAAFRVPRRWPTPTNRQALRGQQGLYRLCDEIIARRRAGGGGEDDLIGLLLNARVDEVALDDAEIRDQVLIFLLAGHETTSTALTYALHLLGGHPDVQRRVRDEVDAVVGDRVPRAADAIALEYTTMVLKETMRLYPSAPLIGRSAVSGDEVCGFTIPPGADVLVSAWTIHRHPAFWDSPARFDPERFDERQEKHRHRYAWLPFGGGPRACIGQHFSMLESTIALAVLVRDFEFVAPPGEPARTLEITMRPAEGVPSTVTPRR